MACHSYVLFDLLPAVGSLPKAEVEAGKRAFIQCLSGAEHLRVDAYVTLGLKPGTRFMLHLNAPEAADIARAVSWLLHTPLGSRLRVAHALTGVTRPSQYNPGHAPKESSPDAPHRYLTVYPFTKTESWHQLPYEERRAMMKEHVEVGRKYSSSISQLLLYSFGIDDQEFIVSYQMDSLEEFQSLVMELRGTKGRVYTKSDTPIFTGVHASLEEALDTL